MNIADVACRDRLPLVDPVQPASGIPRVRPCRSGSTSTVPLLSHATKQILDNWGDQGYELVSVVPGPTGEQLVAYLKRPIEAK